MKKSGIIKIIFMFSLMGIFIFGLIALSPLQVKALTITSEKIITFETVVPILYPHEHEGGTLEEHGIVVDSKEWIAPEDLLIKRTKLEIKNTHKSTLHHMRLIDMNEEQVSSGSNKIIATKAGDYIEGWEYFDDLGEYGLFIKKGTRLKIESMLHNPFPPIASRISSSLGFEYVAVM